MRVVGVRVLRVALLAAFAVFALLSLLVVVTVAEFAAGGDLTPFDVLRAVLMLAPTAALGWLVWREFRPLTAPRLKVQIDRLHKERGKSMIRQPGMGYRDSAIADLLKHSPRAAALMRFDPDKAFDMLTATAEAAGRARGHHAHDLWRALGVLLVTLDNERAAAALAKAHEIRPRDLTTLHIMQTLSVGVGDYEQADRLSRMGRSLAKDPTAHVYFLSNDLWTAMFQVDERRIALIADELAKIAREPTATGFATAERAIDDIEGVADIWTSNFDFVQARMMRLAVLDVRRAAAAGGGLEATCKLAASLIAAGEDLVARANTDEGRALVAEGRALARRLPD